MRGDGEVCGAFGAGLAFGKEVNEVLPWGSSLNEISVAVVLTCMAAAGEVF